MFELLNMVPAMSLHPVLYISLHFSCSAKALKWLETHKVSKKHIEGIVRRAEKGEDTMKLVLELGLF